MKKVIVTHTTTDPTAPVVFINLILLREPHFSHDKTNVGTFHRPAVV